MGAVLEDKRDEIAALCRKYWVLRLYVFGSVLGEDFGPGESDVDMLDELRGLLDTDVDLVMAGAVKNRLIACDTERTKQMLYAA
jgi:uncharacterized protein